MPATISSNRAPVLTLWAAVAAQRLGFRWDESPSLGKVLAGLDAQSKGRRLGIFKPHEEKNEGRPRDLAAQAFALYGEFRPAVPEGVKGWGAKGSLDLRLIRSLTTG